MLFETISPTIEFGQYQFDPRRNRPFVIRQARGGKLARRTNRLVVFEQQAGSQCMRGCQIGTGVQGFC